MPTITIPSAAHKKAADIFSTIALPVSSFVIYTLAENSELTAKQLATKTGNALPVVQRILPKLLATGVIRKETMGVEVYYKLVHGRLETINAAAARLL